MNLKEVWVEGVDSIELAGDVFCRSCRSTVINHLVPKKNK
jgi:hypothetical protein